MNELISKQKSFTFHAFWTSRCALEELIIPAPSTYQEPLFFNAHLRSLLLILFDLFLLFLYVFTYGPPV